MRVLAIVIWLFSALSAYANPTGLDLYILAGQSNLSGRDPNYSLPQSYRDAIVDDWVYNDTWHQGRWVSDSNNGEWRTQLIDPYFSSPTLAVTLAIGRHGTNHVGIITCARGGTSAYDWRPPGPLFAACVDRANEALPGNTMKGLVWFQGAKDRMDTAPDFKRYYQRTINTLTEFRAEFGADLPIVIVGEADDHFTVADEIWGMQSVRALQRDLALHFPRTGYVSAQGLPLMDVAHLAGASHLPLGEMVAAAFDALD